jgi:uncharacterized protein (TIGR02757 family)
MKRVSRQFLESLIERFNSDAFIENDPVSIPHLFSRKEDREIAGFFAALLAWGQRKIIIRHAKQLMQWMEMAPYDFIMHHCKNDLRPFRNFVHRTFNGTDAIYFIRALWFIYAEKGGMEKVFTDAFSCHDDPAWPLHTFKKLFFSLPHEKRTEKHLPDPLTGSAAKRMNMFLRWMVRQDNSGVDFGIWKKIPASKLACPLDVHSGRHARQWGLLKRKQNDWKAVMELTANLRQLHPDDPVRYDFALFGYGISNRSV